MISKELKAQAQLAWANWKMRNPHAALPMSEDDFVEHFEDLQKLFNKGLISNAEMDRRMTEMLKEPPVAASVAQFQPPQRATEDLLAELKRLKNSGVLNEEEYEERRSELYFQRNVTPPEEADGAAVPADDTARRERFVAMLTELHQEGILNQAEHDSAKSRLGA